MIRLAAFLLFAWLSHAAAVQPDEQLADRQLESRARDISAGLRCLVCQNQSIDDSDAPLARDLRLLVRARLQAGDSDDDIHRYVVARYGDFILLRPPFGAATLLLWATPILALLIGAAVAYSRSRSGAGGGTNRLTDAEEESLSRIMRASE